LGLVLEGLKTLNTINIKYEYFLCGLVGTVPGYRSRGTEFDSRRYQSF
jgi:hypothetical protein